MQMLENAAKKHSPEHSNAASDGQIIPIGPCDVTSKTDLDNLVKKLEAREQYLSLVVAAAGAPGPKGQPDSEDARETKSKLWNESVEDWDFTFRTDVTSVFFSTVAFLPLLQAAPYNHSSSVIVISSMSGIMRHSQSHFGYNAAKAATAHLSRMMSKVSEDIRSSSPSLGIFQDARWRPPLEADSIKGVRQNRGPSELHSPWLLPV